MNKAFDGLVMTYPHVVDEALDRAMPAETGQAARIVNEVKTLSSGMMSLTTALMGEDMVKMTDYESNHVTYARKTEALDFVKSSVTRLQVHSLAIGETATYFLDQMRGYLEMLDEGCPREEAVRIVGEVSKAVNARTVHHTTD